MAAVGRYMLQPEDLLSYVLFPSVAKDFLVRKFARETKQDPGVQGSEEGVGAPV